MSHLTGVTRIRRVAGCSLKEAVDAYRINHHNVRQAIDYVRCGLERSPMDAGREARWGEYLDEILIGDQLSFIAVRERMGGDGRPMEQQARRNRRELVERWNMLQPGSELHTALKELREEIRRRLPIWIRCLQSLRGAGCKLP